MTGTHDNPVRATASLLRVVDILLNGAILKLTAAIPPRWRRWLASYYPDAVVRRACWLGTCVSLGEHTYTNIGMTVNDDYRSGECLLYIGSRVSIAPNVSFVCESSPNNSPLMLHHPAVRQLVKREKIIVEDDVWLGSGAIILPGVTIGRGAIIGAGSVVTRDVPAGAIAAGTPARVLRFVDLPLA